MIRRAILVAAAAVAVILVPSAAMAADYEAAGFTSTVSDTTPAVGQSVTVIIHGGVANANKVFTLKIAGVSSTQTLTATANAAGAASFTFTLSAAGVYTLTATNASGAVVSTQTITVHAVGAASVAPGKLSSTGFEGTGLAVGGGLLVLTGAGAVLVARRRKTAQVPA
jgi:hypothetical protein